MTLYLVINDRTNKPCKLDGMYVLTQSEALALHNRLGNAGIYTRIIRKEG